MPCNGCNDGCFDESIELQVGPIGATGPQGPAGINGINGIDGVPVLDIDVVPSSVVTPITSSGYTLVKTTTIPLNTIGTAGDFLRVELVVIGEHDPAVPVGGIPSSYSVKVEFDGNVMYEIPFIFGLLSYNAVKLSIDMIVTTTDTITPYVRWELGGGTISTQLLYSGANPLGFWEHYVSANTSSITLSANKDIKVYLKSVDGLSDVAMTNYKVTKFLKV